MTVPDPWGNCLGWCGKCTEQTAKALSLLLRHPCWAVGPADECEARRLEGQSQDQPARAWHTALSSGQPLTLSTASAPRRENTVCSMGAIDPSSAPPFRLTVETNGVLSVHPYAISSSLFQRLTAGDGVAAVSSPALLRPALAPPPLIEALPAVSVGSPLVTEERPPIPCASLQPELTRLAAVTRRWRDVRSQEWVFNSLAGSLIYSFIHLFNNHLLNFSYALDILSTSNTNWGNSPRPQKLTSKLTSF